MPKNQTSADLREILSETLDFCRAHSARIRFDGDPPPYHQQAALFLYQSILETGRSVLALIDADCFDDTALLVRTILEAYARLLLAAQDRNFADYIIWEGVDDWLKLLTQAAPGTNRYLLSIGKVDPAAVQALKDIAARLNKTADRFKKNNKRPGVWDIFSWAHLKAEYQAIYATLCQDVHNRIGSLVVRYHQGGVERGDQFDATYVGLTIEYLAKATIRIHDFAETDVRDNVHKQFDDMEPRLNAMIAGSSPT